MGVHPNQQQQRTSRSTDSNHGYGTGRRTQIRQGQSGRRWQESAMDFMEDRVRSDYEAAAPMEEPVKEWSVAPAPAEYWRWPGF